MANDIEGYEDYIIPEWFGIAEEYEDTEEDGESYLDEYDYGDFM